MWTQMLDWMNGTVAAVGQAQQATLLAAARGMELTASAYTRMLGGQGEQVLPADKRFADDAWQDNPAADITKQAYLITAQWMKDVADGMQELDPALHQRVKFWTEQLADSLSPTNFPFTNPAVMQEIVRTGGANLAHGMQNLISDLQNGRISQVPEGSFEVGKDLAVTPGKVVYRNPLIELIQYTPSTKKVHAVPLLVIPPWINKYYVMDLSPENSMFKYLVDSGFTLFAISWKNPDESVLDLEWDDYMEMGLLDALRVVKAITGAQKVNTVAYCLGGIAQQYTLAYMAATGDDSVNTATYFTTHQDFSQAGEISAFISEMDVKFLEWLMTVSGGYLDGRNMAATFNMLRANDLLWNYVINNYLMGKQPSAFDLLYWNSDSTRVPAKNHLYLVREFFLENKLKEPDALKMRGVGIDTRRISVPTYAVATLRDHIVPWEGAFKIREMVGGPVRFILAESGHIAGIINHPATGKRAYWTCDEANGETDPQAWFDCAQENKQAGSWWVDWIPWLEKYSGDQVDPPPMGGEAFPPIMDAPGTYVLET
ncbi:MAG: class I poly(R)-hydroxyalkanoic acid synthase [Anaerolineales bacterium]|jgi:polyhydroxyalkanoate synthase